MAKKPSNISGSPARYIRYVCGQKYNDKTLANTLVWKIENANFSLNRTMLVLGALFLLCLSAATTGYEHRKPFKFEVISMRLRHEKVSLEMYVQGKGTTIHDLPMPRPVPINATLYISNILEVSESKQMVRRMMMAKWKCQRWC